MNDDQDTLFIDAEESSSRRYVRPHHRTVFHLRPNVCCFIHAQLYNETMGEALSNNSYTLRGRNTGTTIGGTTDDQGVLRHEPLPDDEYEIECRGYTEIVEVYYLEDRGEYGQSPCIVRVREAEKTQA